MNKPYIINIYTIRRDTPRYLKSRNLVNAQTIDIIPPIYPGNMNRYQLVPSFMEPDRWIIFTDTDDVVFQSDFPDLNKIKAKIIVAPENEIHFKSFWKPFVENYKMFADLKDRPIYNAGCYAMKVSKFLEFTAFVNKYLDHYVKDGHPQMGDQLLFNKWLIKQKYIERLDIFGCLYANLDKGLIKKDGKLWKTKDGKIISCVHANGNTKELL